MADLVPRPQQSPLIAYRVMPTNEHVEDIHRLLQPEEPTKRIDTPHQSATPAYTPSTGSDIYSDRTLSELELIFDSSASATELDSSLALRLVNGFQCGTASNTPEWRLKCMRSVEAGIVGLPVERRTAVFDEMVEHDRHLVSQILGTYYWHHPEQLPEDRPCAQAQEHVKSIWNLDSNGAIRRRQQLVFGDWCRDSHIAFQVRTIRREAPALGPLNERLPGESTPLCLHCTKERRRQKWRARRRRFLRFFWRGSKPKSAWVQLDGATEDAQQHSVFEREISTTPDLLPAKKRRAVLGVGDSMIQPTRTAKGRSVGDAVAGNVDLA